MRLFLFFFIVIIASCKNQQTTNKQFLFTGNIAGLDTGMAYLIVVGNVDARDSCPISKGSFKFSKEISETEMGLLEIKFKDYQVIKHLFFEPGNISFNTKKEDAWQAEIIGSSSNADWNDIIKLLKATPKVVREEMAIANGGETDKIFNNKIIERQQIVLSDFIKANTNSYASLKVINDFYIQANKPDSIIYKLFNSLSSEVQHSKLGNTIHKIILAKELTKEGATIKDFSLPDSLEQLISLDSLKEKIILLDFWASWCAPCRAENPTLKKVYEKYHSKGFEIFAISLDTDRRNWMDALQQDKLPWINVVEIYGWKGMLPELLGIKSIPFNLLLNEKRKIIGKNLRGEDLEKKITHLYNK